MGWFSEIYDSISSATHRAGHAIASVGHAAAVDAARAASVMHAFQEGQTLSASVALHRFEGIDWASVRDQFVETIMLTIGAFAGSMLVGAVGGAALGSLAFGAGAVAGGVAGAELGAAFADALLTWLGVGMLAAQAGLAVARAFQEIGNAMAMAWGAPADEAGNWRSGPQREAQEHGAALLFANALVDVEETFLLAIAAALTGRRGVEVVRGLRNGRFGAAVANWVERNQAALERWAKAPRGGNVRPAEVEPAGGGGNAGAGAGASGDTPAGSTSRSPASPAAGGAAARSGVKPYEVGTYGDLRSRSIVGDGLDLDHQPSNASNIARAEAELGRKLTPDELAAVRDQGTAVAVPQDWHRSMSPTYGGRNTPAQIAADAADPMAAATRDSQALIDGASPQNAAAAQAAAAQIRQAAGGP